MIDSKPTSKVTLQPRRWELAVCLIVAVVLRGAVLWLHSYDLTNDRDAYLGIARGVAEGRGYSDVDRLTPTAFRPPLFTLQLAGLMLIVPTAAAVAIVNLIWGVVAVWAAWSAGVWLGLDRWSMLVALLVAVDPMLLQYSAQPMTEVTCAGLVALLILWIVRRDRSEFVQQMVIGIVFGCLVLCRPTFWPLAGLASVGWGICATVKSCRRSRDRSTSWGSLFPWRLVAGTLIVVAPWVIRNQLEMGSPILMTTHGGYTLLLANNPVFYSEVVDRGWGADWGQRSFEKWQYDLHRSLDEAVGPDASEIARDRWQSEQARQFIVANPKRFLRAVGYRFRSLWSTVPQSEAAASASPKLIQLVGWYYTAVEILFVVGMLVVAASCLKETGRREWWPLFALVLTVQIVHLVYWTNARMRAPIVPVISLFAVAPLARKPQMASPALVASSTK
ncbi:MAG: hypothetical protein JWP89_2101 [Schlesneria sp.]|nr:hypothetical protein [Schlesneria sp.]